MAPSTYFVSFPREVHPIACLLEGFQVQAMIRMNLWIHFVHWNVHYTMVILGKGKQPHPCYASFNIFLL